MTARKPLVLISGSLQELPSTDSIAVNSSGITLVASQATTSGTAWDFTGIPSWVNRITVMFNGISTNGTSLMQVQIGDGSINTSGYTSVATRLNGGGAATTSLTSGYLIDCFQSASYIREGVALLVRSTGNTWNLVSNMSDTATPLSGMATGRKVLSGTLDRVRLTTVNGTDVGDAGSVSISYE